MAEAPLVAVIMGSKSDWETMRHADEVLTSFGVAHECRVVSAHRTPEYMAEYAKAAEELVGMASEDVFECAQAALQALARIGPRFSHGHVSEAARWWFKGQRRGDDQTEPSAPRPRKTAARQSTTQPIRYKMS